METQMAPHFYVVHESYGGPNTQTADEMDRARAQNRHIIQTECPRTNLSHEERVDGWLGCTSDISAHACGKFDTLAAARTCVAKRIGLGTEDLAARRIYSRAGDDVYFFNEYEAHAGGRGGCMPDDYADEATIVEVYATYDPSTELVDVGDFLHDDAQETLTVDTTDAEIIQRANDALALARAENVELFSDPETYLRQCRDEECRDELRTDRAHV